MEKTNYMMTVDDVAQELACQSRRGIALSVSLTKNWRLPDI